MLTGADGLGPHTVKLALTHIVFISSPSSSHHQTYTLSCKTMTCGGCEKTIEDALKKVANVQSVKADSNAGTITVVAASCNSCKDGCSCCKCDPCKCDPCRWYGALPPLHSNARVCARARHPRVQWRHSHSQIVRARTATPTTPFRSSCWPPSIQGFAAFLSTAFGSQRPLNVALLSSTHTCNRSSCSKFSASCHAQPHSLASLDAHLVAAAARAA
jgi:copper chaperone CopZ